MNKLHSRAVLLLAVAGICSFAAGSARATSLTLFVDGNPFASGGTIATSVGATIDVAIGLDDVLDVRQYNLDITFDETELSLTGATQLACLFQAGSCTATPGFLVDPLDPNSAGGAGRRAAQVALDPDFFSIDPAETGQAFAAFFSLEFTVLGGLTADGQADFTIGIISAVANDITGLDNLSVPLSSPTVSASVVPEPSTALLVLAGLAGLGLGRGRPGGP